MVGSVRPGISHTYPMSVSLRSLLLLSGFLLFLDFSTSDDSTWKKKGGKRQRRRLQQNLRPATFGEDLNQAEFGPLSEHPNSDSAHDALFNFFQDPETESFETFETFSGFPLVSTAFPTVGDSVLSGSSSALVREPFQPTDDRYPIDGIKYLNMQATEDFFLDLATPIVGFGFYATDVGDVLGTLTVQTSLNGGNIKEYTIPHTVGEGPGPDGANGAAIYVGIIDLEEFDQITFDLDGGDGDVFGFDSFSVFTASQFIGTEEPTEVPTTSPMVSSSPDSTGMPLLSESPIVASVVPTVAPSTLLASLSPDSTAKPTSLSLAPSSFPSPTSRDSRDDSTTTSSSSSSQGTQPTNGKGGKGEKGGKGGKGGKSNMGYGKQGRGKGFKRGKRGKGGRGKTGYDKRLRARSSSSSSSMVNSVSSVRDGTPAKREKRSHDVWFNSTIYDHLRKTPLPSETRNKVGSVMRYYNLVNEQ